MSKDKALFQSSRFIAIAAIVAGIILVGGNVWSSSKKSTKEAVRVNNHTQTCQILAAQKHDGHIKLSLRNDSNKDITAFVVALSVRPGDLFTVKEDFAYSEIDFVIAPGEVYEKPIPIPSSLVNQKTIPLDLLAVVFGDKSSEGDYEVVRGIEDERLGEKIQLDETVSLLNEMLALQDSKLSTYFDHEFKRDLSRVLNPPEARLVVQLRKERPQIMNRQRPDELPQQIREGLHTGQEYVLGKVQDLENLQRTHGGTFSREEIKRFKQICERMLGRL
jgi:hypothetical protein